MTMLGCVLLPVTADGLRALVVVFPFALLSSHLLFSLSSLRPSSVFFLLSYACCGQ